MKSYLSHLECTYCRATASADRPASTCPECGRVLYARYDLEAAKIAVTPENLPGRPPTMWRYFEVLPVRAESDVVSLGEGFTPLLRAERLGERIGSNALYVKDEAVNPTGSFKVRGLSVAVSKAKELGLTGLALPTAGNAGGALAAYAARAGIAAHVFMPKDAPEANRKEVVLSGGRLTLVDGLIGDAGRLCREAAASEGLVDVSTLQEPYRAEGKKTMGYEIAEQMGWKLPDAIIYPTGGGTGIVGIWKAVEEMEQLGWTDGHRPRMFSVQAEGCAPVVRAFRQGAEFAQPWEDPHTVASGLRVPSPFADYLILRALRESGGGALAVSDQELMEHMRLIASLEGVQACPEGAATAAAARRLLSDGTLSQDDTVVLLNTGSALKYTHLM